MATLDDIASWVTVDQLHRPASDTDITSVARNAALSFYKILCAKIPFEELQYTSPEFALTAGTAVYTLGTATSGTTFGFSPALRAIANVRVTYSSNNRARLRRSHVRTYDSISVDTPGRSATYARWGLNIQLSPPPVAAYTLRFRYWGRPSINATPHLTTIVTPEEWDELIKWETLYRVYNSLDQQEKAMALVQPAMMPRQPGSPRKQRTFEPGIIPRLWNDLLQTIGQTENVDEDFGINPVMRNYSQR